ncbi:DNA damage-binding protein 2 [Balamuthia mandrillaris]
MESVFGLLRSRESLDSSRRAKMSAGIQKGSQKFFLKQLEGYQVFASSSVFERRITCVEWHPSLPTVLTMGVKNGKIALWDYLKQREQMTTLTGRHHEKAGNITELKYSPRNEQIIYTSSGDGTFQFHDLESNLSQRVLWTDNWDYWFTAFDVCHEHNVLLAGDTRGLAHLLDLRTNKPLTVLSSILFFVTCFLFHLLFFLLLLCLHLMLILFQQSIAKPLKLHKKKLVGVHFNRLDGNVVATTGNDHAARLWDLRMLREIEVGSSSNANNKGLLTPLATLPHSSIVSSAYFSPITRSKLLTTTHDSFFHIYDLCGDLEQPLVISHPHRFFRYLSPFKATWHPLHEDMFVCGRYDREGGRYVDVICYEDPSSSSSILMNEKKSSTFRSSSSTKDKAIARKGKQKEESEEQDEENDGEEEEDEDEEEEEDDERADLSGFEGSNVKYTTTHMWDAQLKTISPVNKFSLNGEVLASGSAGAVYVWKPTRDGRKSKDRALMIARMRENVERYHRAIETNALGKSNKRHGSSSSLKPLKKPKTKTKTKGSSSSASSYTLRVEKKQKKKRKKEDEED